MMKHLFGSALALAILGFGTAGCGLFSNETPAEATTRWRRRTRIPVSA